MSEDVDLKVVLDESCFRSASARKKHLSQLKAQVAEVLSGLGFVEDLEKRLARNENRYFASRWQYAPQYPHDTSLRPYLSLELTVRSPQFGVVQRPLDCLVKRLAGQHELRGAVACVAVEETLAEKVISFLRRYAQHQAGALAQPWDETLVRQVYDVYCINLGDASVGERAATGFKALLSFDAIEFGRQFPPFADNPGATLLAALDQAAQDVTIRRQYAEKLMPLIFGTVRPDFDKAYEVFRQHAQALISTL